MDHFMGMVIESAVAIGAGIATESLSLTAFGADSVIELLSAAVLIWRMNVELKRGEAFSEAAERRASQIGGAMLFVLAAYGSPAPRGDYGPVTHRNFRRRDLR
jgi:hypothetical protein